MRSCENKPRREQCIAGQIQLLDPKRISSRERLIGKKEGRGGERKRVYFHSRSPKNLLADLPTPPPQPESVSTDRHVQVILIVYNFANESRTILSITTLWKARSIYRSSRLLSHLETRKFSNLSTLILCFLKRIETRRLDLLRVIDTPRREELPLRFFPRFVRRKWGKEGRPGWR